MADYTNGNLELIVRYDGSKSSFDSSTEKTSYIANEVSKVVFITGSTAESASAADKTQHIWVSNGTTHKYLDMTNINDIKNSLTHIAGLAQGGEVRTLDGGANGINFTSANGISITLEKSNYIDSEGTPYWTLEVNGAGIIGDAHNDENSPTIIGAKKYTDKAVANIIGEGNDSFNPSDDKAPSLYGLKNAVVAISNAFPVDVTQSQTPPDGIETEYQITQGNQNIGTISIPKSVKRTEIFDGDKIQTALLPDVILGQLKFGGLIGAAGVSIDTVPIKVKPSANYVAHFELPNDDAFSVTETGFIASEKGGWYFIVGTVQTGVAPNFKWGDVSYSVGDWFLSTGSEWVKIDNTDAVTAVAGEKGDVPISAITGRDTDGNDKTKVAASLNKADSAIQHLRAGEGVAMNWVNDEYITVGKLPSSSAFNEEPGEITATIKTNTAAITSETATTDGLATVADIRAYLKARLSVKVVTA